MKAIVIKSPKKMEAREVPNPVFGDFEALCMIEASAVCGGTDRHIFNNHTHFKVKFPVIIGHEAVGRVVACGSKVKYFKPGDLISRINNRLPDGCGINLMWGGMAELGIAVDWQAMKEVGFADDLWKKFMTNRVLPKNFEPVASTMIITWRETLAFLKRLNFSPGDKIMIIGSGANALSFVCHCLNLGVKTVIIGNPGRREKFLSCGADSFISYKEKGWKTILKSSIFSDMRGIIDAYGDCQMLNRLLPTLEDGAKVGIYGLSNKNNCPIFVSMAKGDIFFFNGLIYDEGSAHEQVIKDISAGRLKADDFINPANVYSLNDYKKAFKAAWSGQTIKAVLNFLKK